MTAILLISSIRIEQLLFNEPVSVSVKKKERKKLASFALETIDVSTRSSWRLVGAARSGDGAQIYLSKPAARYEPCDSYHRAAVRPDFLGPRRRRSGPSRCGFVFKSSEQVPTTGALRVCLASGLRRSGRNGPPKNQLC